MKPYYTIESLRLQADESILLIERPFVGRNTDDTTQEDPCRSVKNVHIALEL